MVLSRSCSSLIIAAALSGLALLACQRAIAQSATRQTSAASVADEAQEARPNRIRFEYVPPHNPQLEVVYTQLKQGQALEKIQQLFSPFRLPIDLTVKTVECGKPNAWYERPTVTLCYEYLDEIWRGAPKQPGPAGITPVDAVVGQFFYVVAHEFGHAMFDVLQVPSFGSAEDAADEFSTFMMLHLGKDDARRLISGAAYSYRNAVQDPASFVALQASGYAACPRSDFSTCCVSPMGLIRPRSRMLSRKNTSPRVALVTASANTTKSHLPSKTS